MAEGAIDFKNKVVISDLFKQLFNNSIDPLFIMNEERKIIESNDAFRKLFEAAEGESQDSFHALLKESANYQDIIDRLDKGDEINDIDITLKTIDERILYAHMSIVTITDGAEHIIGHQGIIHDDTPRVLAQKKLRRIEKLVTTGRMFRALAHEVRNPLTNVGLAIASLEESDLSEDDRLMVGLIKKNGERINALITQLLDSSQKAELDLKSIGLRQILDACAAHCADRLTLSEVMLSIDPSIDTLTLQADETKTILALNNILINAIEAIEAGGEGAVNVWGEDLGSTFRLFISDNGRGMTNEVLEQLFDPFFTSKKTGTGIGLTAAQSIIDAHGWNIDVKSQEGVGTTFEIEIPLTEQVNS